MRFIKIYKELFIVIILSFFVIKPLFIEGFFPMHDDTQVARVFEMGKAIKDGMFPVRWVSDLGYGYGYPIFNFYAPLSYYIGGLFTIFGLDALTATKIMIDITVMLSGIFMYLLAKELFGKLGAVVSALFYLYAPYHAVDIFVRGDVAELFAYAFIPLAFYGLFMVYKYQKWRFVAIGSLGYSAIILSHNLTAMVVSPFILIFILLNCYIAYKKRNVLCIKYYVLSIILGLGLSAFYWLPALWEMGYANVLSQIGGGADFSDHFVCINQLWSSPWGFGGSAPGCLIDGMSFQIGKLHVILSVLSLLTLLIWRNIKREKRIMFVYILICLAVSTLFTLELSKPVWEALQPMEFIQYPWRFLLLISFFSSLLAGFPIWFLGSLSVKIKYFNTVPYLSGGILIFFLLIFNLKFFNPQTVLAKTAVDYINSDTLEWTTSKISDEYMPKDFSKPNSPNEIVKEEFSVLEGSVTVNSLMHKTQEINAVVFMSELSVVRINIAYFPFWEVFVDGRKVAFEVSNLGIIVSLPSGYHILVAKINQTGIERAANTLSTVGAGIVLIGIIYSRKRLIW